MLNRLTRKLFTLLVLVAALAAISSAPAASTNRRFCVEVPICSDGCCSGYWCCDRWGNCYCG